MLFHVSPVPFLDMGPASVYVSGGGVTQSTMLVSNVGFERKLFDLQKDKLFSSDEPIQLTDPEWYADTFLPCPITLLVKYSCVIASLSLV